MHLPPLLVVGTALTAAWLLLAPAADSPATPPAPPAAPPMAEGHYVLVVEGDRTALAVTHARAKSEPWAGVPKGLTSAWQLEVLDAGGRPLATVPLDVSAFATRPQDLGKRWVEGCIVRDARIGMLVNVPRFAAAAGYLLKRTDEDGTEMPLGGITAAGLRELAGEPR